MESAAGGEAARDTEGGTEALLRASFLRPGEYDEWAVAWRARLERDPRAPGERAASMRRVNPAYIARNHRVEAVIAAALERNDFAPFEEMLEVLSRPYEERPAFEAYTVPPQPAERVLQTFCGT
jgi:uncharacterized protein YdiU (UPF0061 family)